MLKTQICVIRPQCVKRGLRTKVAGWLTKLLYYHRKLYEQRKVRISRKAETRSIQSSVDVFRNFETDAKFQSANSLKRNIFVLKIKSIIIN